jgi:hypothetical protein
MAVATQPTVNLEKVCFIVVKARQFDAKEGMVEEDYGGNETDEGFRKVLEDTADDPAYEELCAFINAMTDDERIELVALCWTGRGDFTPSEWSAAIELATRERNNRTAEYLLGTPLLGDYLEEGLAAFGLSCTDIEKDHL